MKLHDYEIEAQVLDFLYRDEDLKSMLGDNVYPVYIQKDTEGDAVFYDSEMDDPETCKMGNVTNIMHMYFCAVSDRMDNANRIIGKIQDILEGVFSNPYMTIKAVRTHKDGSDLKYEKYMEFLIGW